MRPFSRPLCLLLFLLGACSADRSSDSAGASGRGTTSPPDSSPPVAEAPTKAPLPSCPEGASVDPPPDQLELPDGANANSVPAKLNHLRYLMKRYPRSSRLRFKAAELSLGPAPAGNPVESQRLFEEAIALHENGCRLPEELEWKANHNLGLAHMLQESYGEAAKVFQKSSKRWATTPQAHFDLACAKCRLDEIDACLAAFTETLRVAEEEDPPDYINDELNAYHFIHQARQSRDLAPLRSDPRFDKTIAPHLKRR